MSDVLDEDEGRDDFEVAGAFEAQDDDADDFVVDPTDGARVDDEFVDDHDLIDISTVLVLEEHDNSLVLPVWEPTGDPEVDAALEELASLEELGIHDHADVFTSIHGRLHQRLADISA
ncbi:MAG: hypothetical protein PHU75_07310 [Candidatus Nanopelagicales bacterium]|nr:hypothetical protein [Candidatus Nanopelagicales bacterium]